MSAKRKRSDSEASLVLMDIPPHIHSVYKRLLHADGIAFLYSPRFSKSLSDAASRASIAYNVTSEQALEELRRLLAIKTFMADHRAEKISPSILMDTMWHAAILDTELYAGLQTAIGCTLHHRPSGASDMENEARKMRLTTMEALYTAYFSGKPLVAVKPVVQPRVSLPDSTNRGQGKVEIKVRSLDDDHVYPFILTRTTLFSKIFQRIEEKRGIPRAELRFRFDGRRVQETDTLDTLEMVAGDVLELHTVFRGC